MFLVVFRSRKHAGLDQAAYEAEAVRMEELASTQPGYISFKSYAADDGEVIALSEWESEQAARAWGRHAQHLAAQGRGRTDYYQDYTLFACANPRISHFERTQN
jgi:heme-degrading monooxygenase HmoA